MRQPLAALLLSTTALLGSLLPTSGWAQGASEASIEQLLELTQVEKMMDSMYANVEQAIRAGMQQAASGRPLSDEQRRVIDSLPPRMAQVLREAGIQPGR